jgi:transcriptional regulator GlxA family with amidase domain
MDTDNDLIEIALLAVPEATASTIYGLFDLFASAGRDWDLVTRGTPGRPRIRPVIISENGGGLRCANGAWIESSRRLDDSRIPDAVCALDLFLAPGESLSGRFTAEIQWLRHCHRRGATVAAACTGALLLAESGLLDGADATTHWAFCDAMARAYPRVRVHRERALVVTGEAQRLVMAGGGTSWQDLGLFLVARFLGIEEAMRLARLYLIDLHDAGQQPFAMLSRSRQATDAIIADCQTWLAHHYDEPGPVATMARRSGLSERSFARRFTRATGMSPMEYVHTLRLEEAKQILETTAQPVEAVANMVGYEDSSFFGRLFRRQVGLTPLQYRRRFAALRRGLAAAGDGTALGDPVSAE